jgi:hypothetical protein
LVNCQPFYGLFCKRLESNGVSILFPLRKSFDGGFDGGSARHLVSCFKRKCCHKIPFADEEPGETRTGGDRTHGSHGMVEIVGNWWVRLGRNGRLSSNLSSSLWKVKSEVWTLFQHYCWDETLVMSGHPNHAPQQRKLILLLLLLLSFLLGAAEWPGCFGFDGLKTLPSAKMFFLKTELLFQ